MNYHGFFQSYYIGHKNVTQPICGEKHFSGGAIVKILPGDKKEDYFKRPLPPNSDFKVRVTASHAIITLDCLTFIFRHLRWVERVIYPEPARTDKKLIGHLKRTLKTGSVEKGFAHSDSPRLEQNVIIHDDGTISCDVVISHPDFARLCLNAKTNGIIRGIII